MRPGLKKELLRSHTNYRLARSVVDGFYIASLAIAIFGGLGVFVFLMRLGSDNPAVLWQAVGAICLAVLLAAEAVLQREFLQAFFDIADSSLVNVTLESVNPDPFK